jgi:hypothetical protein
MIFVRFISNLKDVKTEFYYIPKKIDYEACKVKCLFSDTSFVLRINSMT